MAQMVIDKAGDKVIAVVVARLQAQSKRMAGGLCRSLEGIGLELAFQEVITIALIDQYRQLLSRLGQQGAGIPFAPSRAICSSTARRSARPRLIKSKYSSQTSTMRGIGAPRSRT